MNVSSVYCIPCQSWVPEAVTLLLLEVRVKHSFALNFFPAYRDFKLQIVSTFHLKNWSENFVCHHSTLDFDTITVPIGYSDWWYSHLSRQKKTQNKAKNPHTHFNLVSKRWCFPALLASVINCSAWQLGLFFDDVDWVRRFGKVLAHWQTFLVAGWPLVHSFIQPVFETIYLKIQ